MEIDRMSMTVATRRNVVLGIAGILTAIAVPSPEALAKRKHKKRGRGRGKSRRNRGDGHGNGGGGNTGGGGTCTTVPLKWDCDAERLLWNMDQWASGLMTRCPGRTGMVIDFLDWSNPANTPDILAQAAAEVNWFMTSTTAPSGTCIEVEIGPPELCSMTAAQLAPYTGNTRCPFTVPNIEDPNE